MKYKRVGSEIVPESRNLVSGPHSFPGTGPAHVQKALPGG